MCTRASGFGRFCRVEVLIEFFLDFKLGNLHISLWPGRTIPGQTNWELGFVLLVLLVLLALLALLV